MFHIQNQHPDQIKALSVSSKFMEGFLNNASNVTVDHDLQAFAMYYVFLKAEK